MYRCNDMRLSNPVAKLRCIGRLIGSLADVSMARLYLAHFYPSLTVTVHYTGIHFLLFSQLSILVIHAQHLHI